MSEEIRGPLNHFNTLPLQGSGKPLQAQRRVALREWGIEGQFRGFGPYLVNSEELPKIFDVVSGMLYLGRVTWWQCAACLGVEKGVRTDNLRGR